MFTGGIDPTELETGCRSPFELAQHPLAQHPLESMPIRTSGSEPNDRREDRQAGRGRSSAQVSQIFPALRGPGYAIFPRPASILART